MKRFVVVVFGGLVALVVALVWWLKLESGPPTITIEGGKDVVGRTASWGATIATRGRPGLRHIGARLRAGGQTYPLLSEDVPADGPRENYRQLKIDADLAALGVPQGPAQLLVEAESQAWHPLGGERVATATRDVTIDTLPPHVDLLTTQHNMRLGGASLVLFRTSNDAVESGVAVADYFFPAVRGYFAEPDAALAIFAVPQNLSTDAQPVVRAVDAAGNRQEVPIPVLIKGRRFPDRQLQIDDAFLQRKVPEILSAVGKPVPTDLKQGYLTVNRDVRRESEEKLRAVTARSVDRPLWSGVFVRQSNAAPMSAFADRRSYVYGGEVIDQQTHLGYDLASLKNAPVEATQNGIVVFADYLGIYGKTVVLDHGFGVFSLYGHLSSISVEPGQEVVARQTIGQTGETGLAGGDHLHFSIMLRGIHVDPIEWWDPLWMREHVTERLATLPSQPGEAAQPAAAPAAAAPAPAGAADVAHGEAQH